MTFLLNYPYIKRHKHTQTLEGVFVLLQRIFNYLLYIHVFAEVSLNINESDQAVNLAAVMLLSL